MKKIPQDHLLGLGLTAMKFREEFKLVWFRFKSSLSQKRIARIHSLTRQALIPEEVLEERIPGSGLFTSKGTKDRFLLKNGKFQLLTTKA